MAITTKKRPCSICVHFNKVLINKRLIAKRRGSKESYASIARDFEFCTVPALRNHYKHHLSLTDVMSDVQAPKNQHHQSNESDVQGDLPDVTPDEVVRKAEADSFRVYGQLLAAGDIPGSQKALSNALECRKLLWKREDEHKGEAKKINVMDSQEWEELQTLILQALAAYPDALTALQKAVYDAYST